MVEIYDHLPKRQALALRYGTRLRYIKGLRAFASAGNKMVEETFTQDDLDLIDALCLDALTRAKEQYDEACKIETSTNPSPDPGERPKKVIRKFFR